MAQSAKPGTMAEKPLLQYSTSRCTAKKLWGLRFPVLAGWFLILGLEIETEKKHRFSSTLPKTGTGLQCAVCRTKLITITLRSHQGLTTLTQREGRNRYYKGNLWIENKPLQSKLPFRLTTLYPSIPATGLHRETTLFVSNTAPEYQGELHWHLLGSHTQTSSPCAGTAVSSYTAAPATGIRASAAHFARFILISVSTQHLRRGGKERNRKGLSCF